MEFHLNSYKSHQHVEHESKLIETWKNDGTVDHWRHCRMYKQLDPIIKSYPDSKWLTVGDGRFGTDAQYLNKFGIHALPTDINDTSLRHAKEGGFISDYAIENAEKLSFESNHFDFVLCKEAYHHFPRPMLALYEMLRVAKNGVILIEPNDQAILEPYTANIFSLTFWLQFSIKQWIKKKIGKKPALYKAGYESVGNYVYSISKRELEKTALGLNLDVMATKGMNDFYIEGVEFEKLGDGPLFRTVKETISRLDKLCIRRPERYGLLVAILFKKTPTPECLRLLQQHQFNVSMLDKNPYIK